MIASKGRITSLFILANPKSAKDGKAKDYQVKRVRQILTKYGQTQVR